MILLGVTVGGRNNPRRVPHQFADTSQSANAQTSDAQKSDAQTSDSPPEPAISERDPAPEAT
jgi:hypothetical protein